MGEVFRAIDENAGEQVALKFLPADRMANPEALALLKSEVRVAHRIRSPYVCAVHGLHLDTDPAPGKPRLPPFIAMQFIEGEDLHVLLKRVERLSGPKVIRIAHELATGMAAIHAAGILHRDLKPSNVMLDVHGTAQILDLGIAAIRNPEEGEGTSIIAGTPAYMAPEARTQPATPATDIYALGLVLFEIATGEVASRLLRETPEVGDVMERFKEQIPRALFEPISRCLRPNPSERYQSMEELLRALPAPPAPKSERSESITTIARSDAVTALTPPAIALLVACIVIIAVTVFLMPLPAGSVASAKLTREPGELGGSARMLAGLFGSKEDPYRVRGFASTPPANFAQGTAADQRRGIYFWYRSAKFPLEPASAVRGVSVNDPPPARGITTIRLDTQGMLLDAYRLPNDDSNYAWNGDDVVPPTIAEDLNRMRETIGPMNLPFTFIRGSSVPPGWTPPVAFPSNADYWIDSVVPSDSGSNGRLLIAAMGKQVIYIGRVRNEPGSRSPRGHIPQLPTSIAWLDRIMQAPMKWLQRNSSQDVAFWWMYAMPVLGAALAIRNVRLRRCDTRHALRVSAVVFGLAFLGWVLITHPGATGKTVTERWNTGIGISLWVAAEAWISYAAVDPYARLTWKRCLIGYARLSSGWPRALVRDNIVGRSLLTGAAFGLSLALLLRIMDLTSITISNREQTAAMLVGDGTRTVGLLCRAASSAIVFSLLQFVTLVLLHWVTRRKAIAVGLFCVVTPMLWALYRNDFSFPAYLVYPVIGILTAIILIREGVLAHAVGLFFSTVLGTVPLTLNSGAANFSLSVLVLLFLAAIVGAGMIAVLPRTAQAKWLPSDPLTNTGEVASRDS
jgi:hypothetical protein